MNQLKQQIQALLTLSLAVLIYPFMLATSFLKRALLSISQRFKRMVYRTVALFAFFIAGLSSAHAAVPADVTTAITTAVTDVGTVGAAILGVIVAIMA
ncbi:major capsid protein, partial [Nitrosomonas sp. Nm34]|uniref:major capsid protein n=1 Tax=Nitrosomonas sp. Nm34 TaxID=1881055 RepID=UPI0008E52670